MGVIVTILLILFIPVCILLILMVLLQAGKGGGLSGAFGGMGSSQPFLGARGTADFLSKFTVYLAIAFMALSLVLSVIYGTSKNIRVKDDVPAAVDTQATQTDKATATPPKPNTQSAKPAQTQTPSGNTGSSQKPVSAPAGK